jgi:guanine deaminase
VAAEDGRQLLRGRFLHCLPGAGPQDYRLEYLEDGVMAVAQGRIEALLPAAEAAARGMDLTRCRDLGGDLVVPGFVDTHVHAPQLDVIGSHGEQLLEWLERYTFPAEARFADESFARVAMADFLDALLCQGTTSAVVYATSHLHAAEALFAAAAERKLCLIGGKVLMDRNAPEALRDGTTTGVVDSRTLIERWHRVDRLSYAVTPRFSLTSTPEQLAGAGMLLKEYPGVYLQTHLAENPAEVDAVRRLFPDSPHYLDTYDRYGLCTEHSIFAHCLHLEADEIRRLAATGAAVAFCPSSNLFLGSGLFNWQAFDLAGVPVTIGSDVGAGTDLSLLGTLTDAYKVCQLAGQSLDPMRAFYTITLGNARALGLEHRIGNLSPGTDADFLRLSPGAIPLLPGRVAACRDIGEEWFACMILGDDRLVRETWIAGHCHKMDGVMKESG